jgi:hypothetical protein
MMAMSFIHQHKTVLVFGIVLLIAMNVLHGRNVTSIYLRRVDVEPNHIAETSTNNVTVGRKNKMPGPRLLNIPDYDAVSPACKPHFQVASRPNQPLLWSNFSKFKRFYFYHARKAGE